MMIKLMLLHTGMREMMMKIPTSVFITNNCISLKYARNDEDEKMTSVSIKNDGILLLYARE